ncbi:hypothetical protein ACLB2K_039783 [Fragaria x ananassa]
MAVDQEQQLDGDIATEPENTASFRNNQEDTSGNKSKEEINTVPYYKLFSFADSMDYLLMSVGTTGAIGNGLCMPLMTVILGELINSFGNTKNVVDLVSQVALKYVYLAIGAAAAAFLQMSCWMITGERQAAQIRCLYLKTILRQDVSFFDKEANTGEIVGRMSGDTVLIQEAMGEKVGTFIQLVATFIAGFVIAFIKGWHLTLVMLTSIPPLVLSGALISLTIRKLASRGQAAYSVGANVVEQTIGSIRTVVSFTGEKQAITKYNNSLTKAYKSGVKEGLASGVGLGTVLFTIFCTYALAIWYGGKMILEKGYNGGDVLNVIFAVLTGFFSLGQASPCVSAFSAGQAAAYKMFETINRKPIIDVYDTRGLKSQEIKGDIELRDVYFSYPARPDEQIFIGFSLSIPSGATAALVGQSGSGKSTVISLIERFYDPQAGEILIDGINLKEFQLKWIREKIGLVSQEPVLFSGSIKDNIAYGKDGATTEEMRAAAELANAAKFIDKLPQGLDTMVGEHGTQLSGGQKQRAAIARAILKNPKILLLDEATSALDAESERVVQEALDRIMVNRTTVIVAHRLSTVRNADTIAVIHRGKIVEKGLHTELVKDPDGAYSQLIRLQEINSISEHQAQNNHERPELSSSFRKLSSLRSISQRSSEIGNSNRRSHSFSVSHGALTVTGIHEIAPAEPDIPAVTSEVHPEVSLSRLAYLNKTEIPILLLGTIGAAMCGVILPIFGVLISSVIKSFFDPPHQLRKDSKFWALIFVVLGVAALLAHPMRAYFFAVAGCKLIRRVRSLCFEKMVYMEASWFDEAEHSSGAIGARLSGNAASLRGLVGDALSLAVMNTSTAIAGLIIAFMANWQLAFIMLFTLPLLGISGYFQMEILKGLSANAKITLSWYQSGLNGHMNSTSKLIGHAWSGSNSSNPQAKSHILDMALISQQYSPGLQVFFALTMTAVALSQQGSFAPGASKGKSSAASLFAIIDRKSKIDASDNSGTTIENLKGEIEFRHISFKYPNRPNVPIFQDLCLTIHYGKTVALVGESGSGKSTVISLLQRFYDPDSGYITLDGTKMQTLQLKWLRQQMGLVSQEPLLFNDTIRANIAYGKDGSATETEIIAAAELANAHKFISSLQQGYDTIVGERGVQLSGGQKQRVAIARAIMKAPKILLLDEATSALDAESERVVQDALDQVMVDRTTVVVAHRLSTIKGADLIAVVKNGVIAEKGKHETLISIEGGTYASLVALHASTSS